MVMKYIKSVLQFFFVLDKGKRLVFFLPIVVPLSFLVSTFFPIDTYISWISSFSTPYPDFSALWLSLQPAYFRLDIFIIVFISLIIVFSAYATLTFKCFRIGRFSLKGFFRSANDNFIASASLIISIALLYLIWQFVLALFLFLCQKAHTIILAKVCSAIVLAIWSAAFLPLLLPMVMWFPIMAINGLKPAAAFGRALQKIGRHGGGILLSLVFIVVLIVVLSIISGLVGNGAFSTIFNSIAFTISFCYFTVLTMAVYFDIEGIPREDITRSLYFAR